MTLPESTLEGLRHIDVDRGQAIVKLTQAALGVGVAPQRLVEVVEMAAGVGLLVVRPSAALRRIPFLHLFEVSPSRFLLALDPGNDFKTLEIAVRDVLEDVPKDDIREQELIAELLEHVKEMRRAERVSMAEILLVSVNRKERRTATSEP